MAKAADVLRQALTEAEWQDQVIDYAHRRGWLVAHFRPARTEKGWRTAVQADGKGFPDLVLTRDRVVFAELKAERRALDPDQGAWLAALTRAGAEAHVWRPSDWEQVVQVLR